MIVVLKSEDPTEKPLGVYRAEWPPRPGDVVVIDSKGFVVKDSRFEWIVRAPRGVEWCAVAEEVRCIARRT